MKRYVNNKDVYLALFATTDIKVGTELRYAFVHMQKMFLV